MVRHVLCVLHPISCVHLISPFFSFVGCWGAFRETSCLLTTVFSSRFSFPLWLCYFAFFLLVSQYCVIMTILCILQIAIGVFLLIFQANQDQFLTTLWTATDDNVRSSVQNALHCCGLSKVDDHVAPPCSFSDPCLPILRDKDFPYLLGAVIVVLALAAVEVSHFPRYPSFALPSALSACFLFLSLDLQIIVLVMGWILRSIIVKKHSITSRI